MYENRRRGIRYRVGDETVVVHSRYAGKANGCGSDVVLILRVESQVERIWNLVPEDYRTLAAIFEGSAAADDSSLEVRKCLVAGYRDRHHELRQRIDRDIAHRQRHDCRNMRVRIRNLYLGRLRQCHRNSLPSHSANRCRIKRYCSLCDVMNILDPEHEFKEPT